MRHQEELSVPIERVGRYLRFRWDFVAPLPVDGARQRLQDYFTRLGYALASSGDALVMRRGSLARSMLKWSPRNLAVELTARCAPAADGTAVTLELRLNRTGHIIYGAEQYLHAWELKEAETYLRGEPVDFAAMEHFDRRTLERVYHKYRAWRRDYDSYRRADCRDWASDSVRSRHRSSTAWRDFGRAKRCDRR